MAGKQPRIFVSYARKDGKDAARALRQRLEDEHGFALWQDLAEMEGGRDWWRQIEDAIKAPSVEYLVLVMTPAALASDVVRREWRLARQEGVCVVPVFGVPGLDLSGLPGWMRRAHFVDPEEPEQWTRFVRTLESPCETPRVPFMAEDLPEDFVARPAEMEALVAALLDETREEAVAITTALEGAGGFGKTALAQALCHDERVRDAFYDGVLWVTLGEAPGEPTGRIADLIEILTGARPGFDTQEAATARLAEVLAERTMLIVVDDVWNARDLRPFLQGGRRCARLITTRDRSTAPANAREVAVDAMRPEEALELLGHGLPAEEVPTLTALTDRLGEWPLLLKLVNGMVRERVSLTRQPLADALAYVEKALERRGLTAFDARDAGDRGQAVAGTLGVSLDMLSEDQRTRFAELAVFPEDVDVPLAAVETLWAATGGLDDLDTEDLCQTLLTLFRLSLLLTLDLAARHIRLHDVVRAYLLPTDAEARAALHRRLLDAYRAHCSDGWASGPDDGYFFQHLPYHLVEARERRELRGVLLDYDWIAAKLEATGIAASIADYAWAGDDEALRLVQGALRLSAHVLAKDPGQLAGQLTGRLRDVGYPELEDLVREVCRGLARPWLRPETPSLTPPGGPLLRTLEGHIGEVTAVAVLADGRRALSGSEDNTLRLWDLETGESLRTLEGHTGDVTAVAVLADGRRALSGSSDGTLRLWDLETGESLRTLEGHMGGVEAVALLADGRRALSGSWDNTLRLWDLQTGESLRTLEGRTEEVSAVAVLADGRRALSGSDDGPLRLWDLETGESLSTIRGHTNWVSAVAVLADGRRALSGSWDNTLRLWDLETGGSLRTIRGHTDEVNAVAVLADGRRALSGSWDNTLRLWDLETGGSLRTIRGHTDEVNAVAVLADGRRALSGSDDGTLRLWDLETGGSLRTLEGHTGPVNAVAVLADGRRALSGSGDKTLRLWDLETGESLRTLEGHTGDVTAVAVLADGRRALSGSWDNTLRLWDLETGESLRTLKGHTGAVEPVAVLADGRRALSGSWDNTLRLWDLETGESLRTLEGHTDRVWALAVLTDGRRALSSSGDGTLRLWDLESGEAIATFTGDAAITCVAVANEDLFVAGSGNGAVHILRLIE